MTVDDIQVLAAAGESETLELKASTGERVAGAMAVCAMLNHRGGTVLFGVQPNRQVSGQTVSDRTIEQLSSALSEIDPPAFPTIDQVSVRGDLRVVVINRVGGTASTLQSPREGSAPGGAIPTGRCRGTNTTAYCWSGCTGSTDGRTSLSRTGRSTTSMRVRSPAPLTKRSADDGRKIPEHVIRRNCCADLA